MDIEEFREILARSILNSDDVEAKTLKLNEEQLQEIDKLFQEKYSTWEWNYGSSPPFNYKNYRRFPFGSVEVRLEVKHGSISECKIYGDFFGTEDISILEKRLIGQKYEKEGLGKFLKEIDLKEYFGGIRKEDFLDLLIN